MTRGRVPPGVIVLLALLAMALVVGVMSARESHVDIASSPSSPAPVGAEPLTDGEHTGFVSGFGAGAIEFDPAEVFFGAEADAAAAEDGELSPGGLPNPFYVRNPDVALVRLPVAPGFEATLLEQADPQPRSVDAATLTEIYAGEADGSWWGYESLASWPATLTVRDGLVVRADEFYLP